ncbi:MAG: hypothetical protein FWG87_04835 [Defluviitaleaceae bacterium]|nr:hypothetical protein [Defluviitaleaceae bacterium]
MSDLAKALPAYFGLSGVTAVKERGSYLLNSAKIHKSNSTPKEIYARCNLSQQLEKAGQPLADAIIPTPEGEPFVSLGCEIYVMTKHLAGREPSLDSLSDMKMALEALASFHKTARNLENPPEVCPPLTEIFAKESLAPIVKQLNRRPRLTDFDVLILKHADFYMKQAKTAEQILTSTDYDNLYQEAVTNGHICHSSLKEESFSIHDEICYITRLNDARVNLQLEDIAAILRRYARKSSRAIPAKQFLEIYDNVLPLPASAEKIIYAQLLFPWSFLKIVSQYYSKKRNFIPAAINSRMDAVLDEQEGYGEYVGGLG